MKFGNWKFVYNGAARTRHGYLNLAPVILILLVFALLPATTHADSLVEVHITGEPELPWPVRNELAEIFADTLNSVIYENEASFDITVSDPVELAEAFRTGINLAIEPKGYTVGELVLDMDPSGVTADFLVHPIGWSAVSPGAVTDVEIILAGDGIGQFWINRYSGRLEENTVAILDVYHEYLVGLPVNASDDEWALGIVEPHLLADSPVPDYFPGYDITYSIDLDTVATVSIMLDPVEDVIELIRPRMYSMTLPNVVLDRLRERLLAEADFIEGMPKSEVDDASDEIALKLTAALEDDIIAEQFEAYMSVNIITLDDDPVVRIDVIAESRRYDLRLETFVDFSNEERDTAEVECRAGFLLTRGMEIFVNFNFFTNDSTLETDVALGFRPGRGTFIGFGFDLEREAGKYFFEQEISRGLVLRGEIFEDDQLNEFGMTYQFQQYLSGGFFTNGDNEFWARAIFTL